MLEDATLRCPTFSHFVVADEKALHNTLVRRAMAVVEGTVLKALALDITSLSELPASVLSSAGGVTEANFSFNAIAADSLGVLGAFVKLEVLVLDNNDLTSLSALPSLPALKTLWLNNNALDDLEELLNVLGRQCPQLEYLSLLRNPCCPNELTGKQETEYRRYRLYTKFRLPVLKNLDATKFSDAEAAEAREKGKFFRSVAQKAPSADASSAAPAGAGADAAPSSAPGTSSSEIADANGDDEEEDLFAKFDKKKQDAAAASAAAAASGAGGGGAGGAPSQTQGPFFTQQRHFYSGKTSEGNRFIKDDVL